MAIWCYQTFNKWVYSTHTTLLNTVDLYMYKNNLFAYKQFLIITSEPSIQQALLKSVEPSIQQALT